MAGPSGVPSIGGSKYFLLLKECKTAYRGVYFLKKKNEAIKYVEAFITMMETQTGRKVKIFMSDNGLEFCNAELSTYFESKGVIHQKSSPYCPETNGRIEREIGTVKAGARTILLASGLPVRLWAEAVCATVYVLNRVLNKQCSGKTAYESIFGMKPSLNHVRVFGSTAFAHIPNTTVWEAKATKCYLVGYMSPEPQFRLFDPVKNKVFVARNVTFHENVMMPSSEERRRLQQAVEAVLIPMPDSVVEEEVRRPAVDNNPSVQLEASFHTPSASGVPSPTSPPLFGNDAPVTPVRPSSLMRKVDLTPEVQAEWQQLQSEHSGSKPEHQQPEAQPSTFTKRKVLIKTSEGEFEAEVEEGVTTNIIIPKELQPKKSWFKPAVLDTRLRDKKGADATPQVHCAKVCKEPSNYREAMASEDNGKWLTAIADEIASQEANQTWEIVNRRPGMRPLNTKWVFKIKETAEGLIERYKARLVVCVYSQEEGINYFETFASVCRYETIRLLLCIAAAHSYTIMQFDVKTAFLHGDLEEDIYVTVPKGYDVVGDNKVLHLLKSVYGLKQAPRCWNEKFANFLEAKFNFRRLKNEPSVFMGTLNEAVVFLALYVDDGLVMSPNPAAVEALLEGIKSEFQITCGEPSAYVGLVIQKKENGSIRISQRNYVEKMLERFNMMDCNPCSVPLQPYPELKKVEGVDQKLPYRQLVGSLIFLAKCSRPDISFSVSRLAQFMSGYDSSHWSAAKQVLRYLKSTSDLGITN